MSMLGNVHFVRDDDDGIALAVKIFKQVHDLFTGFRIEVTSGFIGQDDRRIVHQCASNSHTLALTTREFVRLMAHARSEINALKRNLCLFDPLFCWSTVVDQRQFDVVQRRGARQQIEGLEDETDFLVANVGELIVIEFADKRPASQ